MSFVPTVKRSKADLEQIKQVDELFEAQFNASPDFHVRAPGRANIIGDHIDYSYFSVLPMAIENNITMAVRLTEHDTITVCSVDKQFATTSFSIANNRPTIDPTKLEWANYFKSGFTVAAKHLGAGQKRGMQVAMFGNVPAGGGLSSSAAFVVAATLATLYANGETQVPKVLLTQLSITCEQLLGMNTGGMDQAASIFGEENHCLLISFRPELKAEPLAYPKLDQEFVYLVANSMVTAVKHETAPVCYNLRVVEVSVAAKLLAKILGVEIPQDGNLHCGTLRGVMEAYLQTSEVTIANLDKMVEVTRLHLKSSNYTRQEVAQELGIDEAEFESKYLTEFPVRFERLKLLNRAVHVYEEAKRVLEFSDLMHTGTKIAQFGDLMNASHASARDLYENSHPDVDELCRIALAAGSAGSRVTGAGFGGCTIHLVPIDRVDSVKKAIREEYFAKKHPNASADALVETAPGQGACILE